VLGVALFQTCSTLKTERAQREFEIKQNAQNLSALKDSITVEFNKKLQAYEYSKDNYLLNEISELKKYNEKLYKDLSKVKGDIIAAINSNASADLSGIEADSQLVVYDSTTNNYGIAFKSHYADSGFVQDLEGVSKFFVYPILETNKWTIRPTSTIFNKNYTQINLTYGFRELEDKYEVFAVSSSPKVKINNLDGLFVLDKAPQKAPEKPKRWGFGPYIGAGLNTDFNLDNPRFGWSIGVSVHYDIFQWRFSKK